MRKKASDALEPVFGGPVEAVLFLLVAATVFAVTLGFDDQVNRVFDVAKARYLKIGGSLTLLVWLGWGLFGRGFRWRSARLFAAPVLALLAAVGISTLLSIDPVTSEVGVYERQFGFQGYLACAGLFFGAATGLSGRRGAYLGLGILAAVGGLVGTYAHLQGVGLDPWGFFHEPDDKVWAFLGNATFAGNSLALLFPMSALLAATATVNSLKDDSPAGFQRSGLLFIFSGILVVLGLQVAMGWSIGGALPDRPDRSLPPEAYRSAHAALEAALRASKSSYRFVTGASLVFMLACAALGSLGPEGVRLGDPKHRRAFDQLLAGALIACVIGILLGIFHSRTRAAWVGSAVAVTGGLALIPFSFRDDRRLGRIVAVLSWSTLALLIVVGGLWATFGTDRWAHTVRSIPAAFDPERTDFGKGQGTRPYLWRESVRVLTRHGETLRRLDRDRQDYRERVDRSLLENVPVPELPEGTWSDAAWRRVAVWLFGIGIETYRYAFMSHKSLRLEALDPMTNHDNPHNNYLYISASLGLVGLAAYLWLLFRLLASSFARFIDLRQSRTTRALAFGIVTSFFSYAVYSVAGFDSIASSVFLYTLLGVASALFEPDVEARREPLGSALVRRWRERRGGALPANLPRPVALSVLLALVGGGLAVRTIASAEQVYRADRALVRDPEPGENRRQMAFQIRRAEEAIRINPNESFYRQQLGSLHAQRARLLQRRAYEAQGRGDQERAAESLEAARTSVETGLSALMSALHHAWAPENIFITAFQLHYQIGDREGAIQDLHRVFDHSPHLGAIRAQLALMQAEGGLLKEALSNCQYAIEASRRAPVGQRVCGRVSLELGDLERAERHLKRARKLDPKDPKTKQYLARLAEQRAAAATSTAP